MERVLSRDTVIYVGEVATWEPFLEPGYYYPKALDLPDTVSTHEKI
jgi:hypothetical protein